MIQCTMSQVGFGYDTMSIVQCKVWLDMMRVYSLRLGWDMMQVGFGLDVYTLQCKIWFGHNTSVKCKVGFGELEDFICV